MVLAICRRRRFRHRCLLGDPVLGRVTGTLVFSRGDEERVYAGMAFSYLARVLEQEVSTLTQCASRRVTFSHRVRAAAALYHYIEVAPLQKALNMQG